MILTDTGPLVAIGDRRDSRHADCVSLVQTLPDEPLLSTWPCLTETMHLAHRGAGFPAIRALWQMRDAGDLILRDPTESEIERMQQLMEKYKDVPMDLADASLVAAAEHLGIRTIFTLDSDFRIYQLADGSPLDVIP